VSDFTIAVLAASGVLFFALGAYILARNPFQRASRTFFILTAGLGIACHLQMLIDRTWDDGIALLAIRLYVFAILISFSSFLLLSQDLQVRPGGLQDRPGRATFLGLMVALAALLSLALEGVVPTDPGFGVQWGLASASFVIACVVLAVAALLEVVRARKASTDPGYRSQGMVLVGGVVTPLVAVGSIAIGGPGDVWETVAAICFLATGASLVYLATAYTLFQLPTVRGSARVSGRPLPPNADYGSSALYMGKGAGPAFDALVRELPFGERGLIITRLHPDQVREKYPVGETKIHWLCGQPGEGRVDPLSLTILQNIIIEHIQNHGSSVILLDGVEFLISENHIDKVLRLLYAVLDSVVVSGSKILVPLDPQALSTRELALIEREFKVQLEGP
jgi:hypothetical protein